MVKQEEIEGKVLEYVKAHPNCDDSEIARKLHLDEIAVLNSLIRLKKQSKVRAI